MEDRVKKLNDESRKTKKIAIIVVVIFLVIAIICGAGIYWFLKEKNKNAPVDATNKPNAYEDTTKNNVAMPIATYNETILFLNDNIGDKEMFETTVKETVLSNSKIKERYNKEYNVYIDGKKVARAKGEIGTNNGGKYIILIDWENNEDLKQYDKYSLLGRFAYISEDYNAAPREYKYYNSEEVKSLVDDEMQTKIIEYMKEKDIDITPEEFEMYEMYIVDIDNDGKEDKVINVNNYLNVPESLESGEAMYYSYIAILSNDNKLKKVVNAEKAFELVGTNPEYMNMRAKIYKKIPMILDINNDKKLDIYLLDINKDVEIYKY